MKESVRDGNVSYEKLRKICEQREDTCSRSHSLYERKRGSMWWLHSKSFMSCEFQNSIVLSTPGWHLVVLSTNLCVIARNQPFLGLVAARFSSSSYSSLPACATAMLSIFTKWSQVARNFFRINCIIWLLCKRSLLFQLYSSTLWRFFRKERRQQCSCYDLVSSYLNMITVYRMQKAFTLLCSICSSREWFIQFHYCDFICAVLTRLYATTWDLIP